MALGFLRGQFQRHFGNDRSVQYDGGESDNEKEVSNYYGRSSRVGGYRFLCLSAVIQDG